MVHRGGLVGQVGRGDEIISYPLDTIFEQVSLGSEPGGHMHAR